MNYQETIEYLYNATPVFEKIGASAYKEGLANSLALDAHFSHPHRLFKSIHVAGTNGKGSCSHTLAAILQSAGYRVGLFTSPHLIDFRERIRVNGKCIPQEYVVRFVEEERSFFEPLQPSFFELTTALAFKYFAEEEVDYAVIEVGLGGRLDCTNIISPILSVITNISLDHTQFLGHTLEAIAHEKAGIIKSHVPIVIGETTPETRAVFLQQAQEKEAPIYWAEEEDNDISTYPFELTGTYQEKNKRTILCAAHQLARLLPDMEQKRWDNAVRTGMQNVCRTTGLMGRWQQIQTSPLVICDTGHNAAGWSYLSKQIASVACTKKRIVFGMVDDKDIDTVMQMLPQDACYYWCQASTHRAIPCDKVAALADSYSLHGRAYPTVGDAFRQALSDAAPTDFIFIGGSSYVVSDFLSGCPKQDFMCF